MELEKIPDLPSVPTNELEQDSIPGITSEIEQFERTNEFGVKLDSVSERTNELDIKLDSTSEKEGHFNGHLEMLPDETATYSELDTNLVALPYNNEINAYGYCFDGNFNQAAPCLTNIMDELQSFQSTTSDVAALKEEHVELKRSLAILSEKYASLERIVLEMDTRNRSLEREVDLQQNESEEMKRKILRMTSDLSRLTSESQTSNDHGTKSEQLTVAPEEAAGGEGQGEQTKDAALAGSVEMQLQTATQQIAELEKTVQSFMSNFVDLGGKVSWLESELQRFVRRHSIIIENFCPKEDKSASEMFLIFVNSVLEVKTHDSDIDSLHLIDRQGAGSSPQKRPRPILVTFTCYRTRARIYKAWLGYRSSKGVAMLSSERGQGLSIKEYLTEIQEAVYQEAVKLKDEHLISDCWTFKGKTFIKTLSGEIKEFHGRDEVVTKDETRSCLLM